MRISDWSSDVCSSDLFDRASDNDRIKAQPPGFGGGRFADRHEQVDPLPFESGFCIAVDAKISPARKHDRAAMAPPRQRRPGNSVGRLRMNDVVSRALRQQIADLARGAVLLEYGKTFVGGPSRHPPPATPPNLHPV